MIDDIYEQSTFIIDLSEAVLAHRQGLSAEQVAQFETIHRRAVDFITTFIEAQERTVERFRSYLNHDALTPLTVIIGHAELLLMYTDELGGPYQEAVQRIRDSGYTLRDCVNELHEVVLQLA